MTKSQTNRSIYGVLMSHKDDDGCGRIVLLRDIRDDQTSLLRFLDLAMRCPDLDAVVIGDWTYTIVAD